MCPALRPLLLLLCVTIAAHAEDPPLLLGGRMAQVVVDGAKDGQKYRLKFAKETLSLPGILEAPVRYTATGDKKKMTFTGRSQEGDLVIDVSGTIDDKDNARGTVTRRKGKGEAQTLSFSTPASAGEGASISGSYKVEIVGRDAIAQIKFGSDRLQIPSMDIDLPVTVVEDKKSKTKVFTAVLEDGAGNRLEVKGSLTDKGFINGTIIKALKGKDPQVLNFRLQQDPAKK